MLVLEQGNCGNQLLRKLSDDDFVLLAPRLTRIDLKPRHMLAAANERIDSVYFLEGGVASVVTAIAGVSRTEVGIFGREGFSGIAVLLGTDRTPHETLMQVDGLTALRIDSDDLRNAVEQSATLRGLLLRYVQTFMLQTAASATSNAHNLVEERLSRWLLMCHDRVDGDNIQLTHEFMSMMIATQRTRVTVTLHTLEGIGAIRSTRGQVTIVDRGKLLDLAGGAYGQPEEEYRRIIGPMGR